MRREESRCSPCPFADTAIPLSGRRLCSVLERSRIHFAVSVVIPFYNGHADLPRALASLRAQTIRPAEIIIVDDASPVPLNPEDAPEARVIRHDRNRGIPGARNTGLKESKQEWVAFLDQDDEWHPRKLELQWRAIEASNDARATLFFTQMTTRGTAALWPAASRVRRMRKSSLHALKLLLLHGNQVPFISVLLHRALLESVGGFDERRLGGSDDYALMVELAARGVAFEGIEEPLTVRHETGRNYSDPEKFLRDDLEIIEGLKENHAAVRDLAPTARAAAYFRCARGLAARDPARARKRYEDALREDPRLLRARIGRALLHTGAGNLDRLLALRSRIQRLLRR